MLGWLVEDKHIAPHIPVWDKAERDDGTFGRSAFIFDAEHTKSKFPRVFQQNRPASGLSGAIIDKTAPSLRSIIYVSVELTYSC